MLRYSTLFDYTQEELYRIVHGNGGVLVQAHPMRCGKNVLLDPRFLDGVEVNSHALYDFTHCEEMAAFAHENGLLLTSGGDYHADTHRPRCGVYLPDDLADTRAIIRYLQESPAYTVCYQEPFERQSREMIFRQ